MSLQRQFFLLSYLKTLSSGPAGVEPATFHSAVECSPNWANQASVIIGWWPGGGDNLNINYASFWLCIIDWSRNVFLLDLFRHKDVDLVIIRENTEGEYSHIEHEVCGIFKLFVKLLLSTCTVNSIKEGHLWDWHYVSILGHFPFVTTDRPDCSRHNENFTFKQNYPTRLVKS